MQQEHHTCLNCGSENNSKFCKDCGQSMNTHRLSVGHIAHEVMHYFTHADKGLIYIIKEMFIRPGFVVQEYIDGKRKKYFNPFTFLLLCSTLSAYVYYKLSYYSTMHVERSSNNAPSEIKAVMMQTSHLMEEYGKIITIFLLPLLASISILFYFRKKYNYAEHLTIFAFIFAQISIINIVLTLVSHYFFPNSYILFNMMFQIVFWVYMSIVFSYLFKEHIILSFIKSLFIIFIFIILYWVIALSAVSIYNLF